MSTAEVITVIVASIVSAVLAAYLIGMQVMFILILHGRVEGTDLRRELIMPWRWGWKSRPMSSSTR